MVTWVHLEDERNGVLSSLSGNYGAPVGLMHDLLQRH